MSDPNPSREGKNIVLCFDGTNNAFLGAQTNVYRLYSLLDHDAQATFYAPGVGTLRRSTVFTRVRFSTLRRSLQEIWGLAFGFGIYEDVGEGYRFLMNHYREGDRIFLFGFSRGAYTARVLAGLLHALGILRPGNEHLIPYALDLYRSRIKDDGEWQPPTGKMTRFRNRFSPYRFDKENAPVHYMGLFDSVSALGWPFLKLQLPHTDKNPIICEARHAIALDERRGFYRPPRIYEKEAYQSYREAWFAGVHSDVGGGYKRKEGEGVGECLQRIKRKTEPDDWEGWGLGRAPLEWILVGALRAGLKLAPTKKTKAREMVADLLDTCPGLYERHESLRWLWHLAELIPRWHHTYDSPHKDGEWSWRSNRWQYRPIPENAKLHETACLYHESSVYTMRDREPGFPGKGDPQCRKEEWEAWEKLPDVLKELSKTPSPLTSPCPAGDGSRRDEPPA